MGSEVGSRCSISGSVTVTGIAAKPGCISGIPATSKGATDSIFKKSAGKFNPKTIPFWLLAAGGAGLFAYSQLD